MDNFLAVTRPDYAARWESEKPTRAELTKREQQYYERFGEPWGDSGRGISPKSMLARVIALFGVLGALAILAK